MRLLRKIFICPGVTELDRSIGRLKEIRDSYRAMNVEIYGEEMARLLNDW